MNKDHFPQNPATEGKAVAWMISHQDEEDVTTVNKADPKGRAILEAEGFVFTPLYTTPSLDSEAVARLAARFQKDFIGGHSDATIQLLRSVIADELGGETLLPSYIDREEMNALVDHARNLERENQSLKQQLSGKSCLQ